MTIFTTGAGLKSAPYTVPRGAIVTVTPGPGASAAVESTSASAADVTNNVAVWASWPNGSVSGSASSLLASDHMFVRLTATGGVVTCEIDENPSARSMAPFRSDWTPVGGASGGISPRGTVAVAAIGDSITWQANNGDASAASTGNLRSIGYMTWLSILSEGRAYFDQSLNFGKAGEQTYQMLARTPGHIQTMLSLGVRLCAVHGGTNDLSNNPALTAEYVAGNIAAICDLLLAAGITPIVIPILPRFYGSGSIDNPISATDQKRLQRYATLQRQMARSKPGVLMADPTLELTDHSDALGYPIGKGAQVTGGTKTSVMIDGLHPSPRGGFIIGRALLDVVEPLLPAVGSLQWSRADVYDATYNPSGNLLTNGFMAGTAGVNSTGSTGQVADGWTSTRWGAGTLAVAASKGTVTVGKNTLPAQVLTLSGATGAAEKFRLYVSLPNASFAVGDRIYAEIAVSVSGVTAGSLSLMALQLTDGSVIVQGNRGETGMMQPDDDWKGVIRTPSFVVTQANNGLLILEGGLDGTVASNGATVLVSRATVRKVES